MTSQEPTFRIERHYFKFQDTPKTIGKANFAIGDVPEQLKEDPAFDEDIFYYCENDEELSMLFDKSNNLDFYIINEEEIN